ncbi:MAG: dihydrolipoyl dehydrogenase [Parachlamydiaceae bacterium]|nr:dihydrolipoyl dehydrogenase [Parachlamydiaceae bacterium]
MQNQQNFDVVVLGGGPGGYPAAIKASQSGKSVALIDPNDLGGTCLNRGCIPSKILIANAEFYKRIQEAEKFGVKIGNNLSFDYAVMAERKDKIVAKKRKGLEGLIRANPIVHIQGMGKFTSPHTLKVVGKDNVILEAKKVIIATGSEPRNMSAFPFDHVKILDSTSLLALKSLPKSLVIVGGGVIGCEFASLYNTLGVEVTIVEMLNSILPMESQAVISHLSKNFLNRGIKILTQAAVKGIVTNDDGVIVTLAEGETISASMALVAVGRTLNTSNIGLDAAGVIVEKNGIIAVNDKMETNVPSIYAVGDISSTFWLAHVATRQGLVAGENAVGGNAHMSYAAVPSVIFTDPEIGSVGLSLEAAKEKGYNAVVGAFPFAALAKSEAINETDGFAQIVIDKDTGQILGAQVVGFEASSLIAEMVVAITNELTVESITESIHAHPTIAEAWLEAALQADGTPLHLPPK